MGKVLSFVESTLRSGLWAFQNAGDDSENPQVHSLVHSPTAVSHSLSSCCGQGPETKGSVKFLPSKLRVPERGVDRGLWGTGDAPPGLEKGGSICFYLEDRKCSGGLPRTLALFSAGPGAPKGACLHYFRN